MDTLAHSGNYVLTAPTVLDRDVPVWTLAKYIFKWMFAFLLVNAILTAPVLLFIAYLAGIAMGHSLMGGQQ
jgi:hypothetical protein